jgi:uncharacterized protein with PQ loop repeat
MSGDIIDQTGLIAAIILPLFNIPLILRMIQRKSAEDISFIWVGGVWVCILLMIPSGLRSEDITWRAFNIMNVLLFTAVFIVTVKYKFFKK